MKEYTTRESIPLLQSKDKDLFFESLLIRFDYAEQGGDRRGFTEA